MASEDSIDLIQLGSVILDALDPRNDNPFDRSEPAHSRTESRALLMESLLGVDLPETSAMLSVIAGLTEDELLRAQVRREVGNRDSGPRHLLADMARATVTRTVEMVHVLRDGDNVMLAVRLPSGEEFTVVVYIDHNLGTVVKDAFVLPDAIDDVIELMQRETADNLDTAWNDIDLADARARITDAITVGAHTVPPFVSDTWPGCRPLVEWATRLLPSGGSGYVRPEWDEAAVRQLTESFLASPYGAGLDTQDGRGLLDSILWFGRDFGPGDPMRWSPVAVEILLADWIPRKVVADPAYLSQAPDLLRAFIRFCHAERGIRAELTADTLDAVDEWEPEYQQTIRTPRPQGPAALLAAMGLADDDEIGLPDFDWSADTLSQIMTEHLRDAVGGEPALAELDANPLPGEDFDWRGIPDDIHQHVAEVLALCDQCCAELLCTEYRTACRRFLARAATGDPGIFRRKARADIAAAAVCWVVGKANDLFGSGGSGMQVKDLMAHFGIRGSASQRAGVMLRAGDFPSKDYGEPTLGSPDYLIASRHDRILRLRDQYAAS